VFKIDLKANPVQQVLYSFTDGADGGAPMGPLIRDAAGNLYGTTAEGGQFGWGTVFRLDNTGKETVLYAFTGGTDGSSPRAGVIRDSTGNFYGTTEFGGALSCDNGNGCGVVFKINKSGVETVLHTFTGGMSDGSVPVAGLVRDQAGILYGTTDEGGDLSCPNGGGVGCGVVFKVDTSKTFTLLHAFTGGSDGSGSIAGLTLDSAGNIYGTALEGAGTGCSGFGCGVVFEIIPN
jgi:uncharacterized repeat protein (TIGR03803 family)